MTGWLLWIAVLLTVGPLLHHFEERLAGTPSNRSESSHRGATGGR